MLAHLLIGVALGAVTGLLLGSVGVGIGVGGGIALLICFLAGRRKEDS